MPRKRHDEGTRAPNMTSSTYFGRDGYWHGRVTMGVKDDGKPDRRHVMAKTEGEVIEKVRQLEKVRDSGRRQAKTSKGWTVEKWLSHWLEDIAAEHVRPKTYAGYRTAVYRHLIPGIGAHRLKKLDPEYVEKLYAKLRKAGLKPATVHQVHRTLRTALNEAVRRGYVGDNAAQVAKSPTLVEEEIEPFTVEEAQRILDAATGRYNGARFALALTLGLRQGEALGLQWADIELARGTAWDDAELQGGTLAVRRAIQRHTWRHGCDDPHACGDRFHKRNPCKADCKRHTRACPPPCRNDCSAHAKWCPERIGGGLVVVPTKSRSGRRRIGLPAPLLSALQVHRAVQEIKREMAANLWEEGGWMFTQSTGKPIDPRADLEEWRTLLQEADVRPARLHDARHTAATFLLVLKVPTPAVMRVMGWSQASMTVRYQHIADEVLSDIAGGVGGLLWKATPTDQSG